MSAEFIIFAPFLSIVALMFVGFAYVHYLDNRP
jgi:hypothetical protein